MLMISITFFQRLAVMCLTLYTSVAFASPISIDFTPKPGLHRRRPLTNLCNPPIGWERRQCVPEHTPWTWQDVCSAGPRGPWGACFPTQVCENYTDEDGDRNIRCIENYKPGQTKPRTESDDPFIGASEMKEAGISLYAWKFQHNVKITDNVGLSSVAANLLSSDGTFVVTPHSILVGKVQGKEITACKGERADSSKTRECYPQAMVNLKKGDTINFTWSMASSQSAKLEYAIIPKYS